MEPAPPHEDILRFIVDQIDTVPHLEALLLLWENPSNSWRVEDLTSRIYVSSDAAARILRDLEQRKLVKPSAATVGYVFDFSWDPHGEFMRRVAATYRRHLVQVTTMIHAKASPSVREFARAFEIKKER